MSVLKFTYSINTSADSQTAANTLLNTLLPLGFRIVNQSSHSLVVESPGYNSTRQNTLLAMSRAEFTFSRSKIDLQAELGGIDRMARLLLFLILGLGILDTAIFFGLWFFLDAFRSSMWLLYIPTLALLPWLIVGPLIIRIIRKNAERAAITLLENAAGARQ